MSLFKRFFRDRDDANNNSISVFKPQNATIKALGSNLQKRFSRGVQYNMKILIRGDRNVGKSALLNRLKGLDFVDQYIPTEEIEVACIHWTYKCTDDVVKVEVWDVVDKGRKKIVSGLKLENNGTTQDKPTPLCLDAEFLDVYKGAHGVILMLDMTKSWTLNYVERELSKLPEEMPVLVLANHIDMGHHRTVSADQVLAILEPLPGYEKGLIKYWESSMQNGYGLVYIHKFFSVPFLLLQRDTLQRQLSTNDSELKCTMDDLAEFEECVDHSYESFVKSVRSAKAVPDKPTTLAVHSNPCSQINSPSSPCAATVTMTPVTDQCPRAAIHPPQARPIPGMDKLGLYPLPVPTMAVTSTSIAQSETVAPAKKEIFDFVPDEQPELSSFLDDPMSPRSVDNGLHPRTMSLSSSEEECEEGTRRPRTTNPMVAVLQDDLDEEEQLESEIMYNGVSPGRQRQWTTSSDDDTDQRGSVVVSEFIDNEVDGSRENGTINMSSTMTTVIEDPSVVVAGQYSQIIFDATDLDILEQISSKKEADQTTVDSTHSSIKKKTKKSKKHHKKSEDSKESGDKTSRKKSKKKKSESNVRRSEDDDDEEHSHNESVINDNQYKRSNANTMMSMSCGDPLVICKTQSSDSLEKFLNE